VPAVRSNDDTNNLHYVSAASQNPAGALYLLDARPPTEHQDAVDAAGAGGSILVANGTYAAGETPPTSSVETQPGVLEQAGDHCAALNGAQLYDIDGKQAMRCAYLANGAAIIGFTITNGTAGRGGGVGSDSTGVVSNCVITGNSATGGT